MHDPAVSGTSRWSELLTPTYSAATTTLCLGVALFAFNGFLVSTSLPTAVREIGGLELISWAFTIYLVLSIVGGASGALLKARLGARTALVGSALVFLAGTLIAAFASSMTEVLVGRALQGLGEGIIAAICYALIPELFPSRLVARVFGAEAVVWAVAAFGGPLISGLLTEQLSWRAAFLVNVPLALIFIALVLRIVPKSSGGVQLMSVPFLRLSAIGSGIMLVALASIMQAVLLQVLFVAGAAILLASVVAFDRRSATPLFPSDAFALNSVVGIGLWIVLLMPVAQAATSVYLVMTLQELWGYGPTKAGAFNATFAIAWSLCAILVANLHDPRHRAWMIRLGPTLLVAGLATIVLGFSMNMALVVMLGQILIGTGFGVCWGFVSQTVMESARSGERDRASALLPTLQSAGYAIGAAVAGLAANAAGYPAATTPEALRDATITIFIVSTVIGLGAMAAGYALRQKRKAHVAVEL
ncbi:MFS transporter [Phyllobacterium endophyticum]|uniref:MFS transporter n=1 Tax=Phyllobacterium endophyticum TaxID=1149773 RepID=A0A2P7AWL8_9HYPH|nr:MFS transporter [Phyllobacterium endophyticum]MBB3235216.1 MFS family permease [Phyllobacterium endophyticum]PSH58591.1 MFS transporter [Phyllobacterium endophyticum]TYR39275.1 MFS transporter [Phyllobacterium endophyticum]